MVLMDNVSKKTTTKKQIIKKIKTGKKVLKRRAKSFF